MLSKYHATLIAIFYLAQNSQNLLAAPNTLEMITENSIQIIANEKLEYQKKLQKLDNLISYTKKNIDTEAAFIKRTRSELDKYEITKPDPLFFPAKTAKLEQNINLLNQSHLIKGTDKSSDIIAISNRIFLSEGNYFTYETEKGFTLVSSIESSKDIQKNATQFDLASNEEQALGVIVGSKQKSNPDKTATVNPASLPLIEFINQGGLIGGIIILSGLIVISLGLLNYSKLRKFNQLFDNPALLRTVIFSDFKSIENSRYSCDELDQISHYYQWRNRS